MPTNHLKEITYQDGGKVLIYGPWTSCRYQEPPAGATSCISCFAILPFQACRTLDNGTPASGHRDALCSIPVLISG